MDLEVGVDHADQRERRKVVALGEHLGADHDVHLAREDTLVQLAPRVLTRERIGVGTGDARVRESFDQRGFELLRADAGTDQLRVATGGAFARHAGLRAAVMAAQ